MSNIPARLRAPEHRWHPGAESRPAQQRGRKTSLGNFAWCKGMGIPADTREKNPSSEGAGEAGVSCCRGGAQKDQGKLVCLRPLDFPPLYKNYSRIVRSKAGL